jgi:LysM repeat protein
MTPRMAEKKPQKTIKGRSETEQPITSPSWLDYFRFGESYTSLVLGIIVVIITTVLLVFLVKDRNVTQVTGRQEVSSTSTQGGTDESKNIAQTVTSPTTTIIPTVTTQITPSPTVKVTPSVITKNFTVTVTKKPTPTVAPTKIKMPSPTITVKPTITTKPTVTKVPTPTKVIAQTNTTTSAATKGGTSHIVASGDTLWSIAEKYYKSGYNWVDISRVNNLSNPGIINVGTKLIIPNVQPKLATVINKVTQSQNVQYGPKITGSVYTIQKGDHLWGIAVRAYNDGYKWAEIARVNNITNPGVIHVGNVLKIPRTNAPNNR